MVFRTKNAFADCFNLRKLHSCNGENEKMERRNIQFSPPDISEAEIEEVCEALRSGWITTGPRTKELEKRLAAFCHTDKLVCLNSATAAEELNLRVLGIGAAHSLGASRDGKMAGEIADFTSFSFHAVKNFTTAEGGAATWRHIDGVDDEALYKQYQLLSLHGQSKDALAKTKLGAWEYDIVAPYYKCNMTDIMAAIGLRQLDRYAGLLERRKQIIAKYDEMCDELGVMHLNHYGENHSGSGHLYLTRVQGIGDEQRREIIIKMAEQGIATNVHYKPLPMMTAYKAYGWDIKDFPNAYAYYENLITLPLHTLLSDDDVEYVVENFKNIVKEYLK